MKPAAKPTRRVIVCGDRDYVDPYRVRETLDEQPRPFVLVHGGCRGVDTMAGVWADEHEDVTVEEHPADWTLGKVAGPMRNAEMIAAGADLVIAFPLEESRGTWNLVNLARAKGIPVEVVKP